MTVTTVVKMPPHLLLHYLVGLNDWLLTTVREQMVPDGCIFSFIINDYKMSPGMQQVTAQSGILPIAPLEQCLVQTARPRQVGELSTSIHQTPWRYCLHYILAYYGSLYKKNKNRQNESRSR